MAANPKTLRITAARDLGEGTRALDVVCSAGEPFTGMGGKYIIVHTGLMDSERAVKRAYSLSPIPDAPGHARLFVKKVGKGSCALHQAAVGTELGFSGPWGKLLPEAGLPDTTLVVATDTGITTALGLCEEARLRTVQNARAPQVVLWLRDPDDPFLGLDHARATVEAAGAHFVHAPIPPVAAAERAAVGRLRVLALVSELRPPLVIATGDGALVHPLQAELAGDPHTVPDVRIECFFHNPSKKSS